MNQTSSRVIIGNCTYTPLIGFNLSGTLSDFCRTGRRAYSNVTFMLAPNSTESKAPLRGFRVSLLGLELDPSGQDQVVVVSGNSLFNASAVQTVIDARLVTANWSVTYPTASFLVFSPNITINYMSPIEKDNTGLTVQYEALTSCPAGYEETGAAGCRPCLPGFYRDENMSPVCIRVPSTAIAMGYGSAAFMACPENYQAD